MQSSNRGIDVGHTLVAEGQLLQGSLELGQVLQQGLPLLLHVLHLHPQMPFTTRKVQQQHSLVPQEIALVQLQVCATRQCLPICAPLLLLTRMQDAAMLKSQ